MRIDHNSESIVRQLPASAGKPPDASRNDVVNYIAELSAELGQLAAAKDLVFLSSLLSLATAEAKRMLGSAIL